MDMLTQLVDGRKLVGVSTTNKMRFMYRVCNVVTKVFVARKKKFLLGVSE